MASSPTTFPSDEERFISQILLEFPLLIQQSEANLRLSRPWATRRRRTALDFPPDSTSVGPKPSSLPSSKNVNESSPITPLSLGSPSEESDENNTNNVKIPTKKKKKASLDKMKDRCSGSKGRSSKKQKIGSSNSEAAMEMAAKPSVESSTTNLERMLIPDLNIPFQ